MNCKEGMTLSDLVKDAKQRMKHGFWKEIIKERQEDIERAEEQGLSKQHVVEQYKGKLLQDLYIKSDMLRRDEALYKKAVEIFESDEIIINPLARLVEHEYYDELDEDDRVAYMFELSTRYLKCKEKYEKNRGSRVY